MLGHNFPYETTKSLNLIILRFNLYTKFVNSCIYSTLCLVCFPSNQVIHSWFKLNFTASLQTYIPTKDISKPQP